MAYWPYQGLQCVKMEKAHVMLIANVNVSDGHVNGRRGEVVHVVTNNSSEVSSVLVDNSKVR